MSYLRVISRVDYPKGHILSKESHLLQLYLYACGKSEIPLAYHRWCLLSLVAASVGNRVYYNKFGHKPLHPNLFVFLVGPSGLGKGAAMSHMLQLEHQWHHVLNGAATHKALVKRFSTPQPQEGPGYENCYLIHEELGNSIPSGTLGNDFVKFVTDTYDRAGSRYTDATRTEGEVEFAQPCLNWLAGTTPEWLAKTISYEDMLSGFFGRVIGVPAWYDDANRVYHPARHDPVDRQEVVDYLCARIHLLTRIPAHSQFKMTKAAERIDEERYVNQLPPEDERLRPYFKRESDLILKLAMVLSLCRSQNLTISVDDINDAHDLVTQGRKDMKTILEWATRSTWRVAEQAILDLLEQRRNSWVRRARILQEIREHNLSSREADELLETLTSRDDLKTRRNGNTVEYKWVDGSLKLHLA